MSSRRNRWSNSDVNSAVCFIPLIDRLHSWYRPMALIFAARDRYIDICVCECVDGLVSAFRLCFVCARERIFSIYERVQRARSRMMMMTIEVGGAKGPRALIYSNSLGRTWVKIIWYYLYAHYFIKNRENDLGNKYRCNYNTTSKEIF